eukprot:2545448-Prymnesium_polylepis.1
MPPRLYSSLAKAVHHWYLGQGGSFTEEDTKLVVALRARGLTWGQIGEETNRYKEEARPLQPMPSPACQPARRCAKRAERTRGANARVPFCICRTDPRAPRTRKEKASGDVYWGEKRLSNDGGRGREVAQGHREVAQAVYRRGGPRP